MNAAAVKAALATAEKLMMSLPVGTIVWHRADGRRGIVEGYVISGDGGILVRVTYGPSTDSIFPFEVSRTRVPADDDGEQWKNEGLEHGS